MQILETNQTKQYWFNNFYFYDMKQLTAQYPWAYTKKFEVSYTDFQPSTYHQKSILLFNLPKSSIIAFAKIFITEKFQGTINNRCGIYLSYELSDTYSDNYQNALLVANGLLDVNNNYGVSSAITNAKAKINGVTVDVVPALNAITPLYICLNLAESGIIDTLISGKFYVWINYFQMK